MELVKEIVNRAIVGVRECMPIVRAAQQGTLELNVAVKGDKSLVTIVDQRVEEILYTHLGAIPGVQFWGEEGTASGGGKLLIVVDPVDGTRPLTTGLPTSTIIVAVFDPYKGVVGCVIGIPATGQILSATADRHTTLHQEDGGSVEISTSDANLVSSGQATVFLDCSHGRTSLGRTIISDEHVHRLMKGVTLRARLAITGSNGLNFALVAKGGIGVAGQITTNLGGIWDIAGALLVRQAGGACIGMRLDENGKIVRLPWNQIALCDFYVTGNDMVSARILTRLFIDCKPT